MNQIKLFIELTRLEKPIGYMLLFWPCTWGLTLAYDFTENLNNYFFYLMLFFLGAVLMRSAGCIVNDILDKEFDKKVFRTKNRPIASGKVAIKIAFIYATVLCLLALVVLLNFNKFTIILALGSMPLAFTYPLMKRFTYWPQLFLGITFNYGLILGWTAMKGELSMAVIIFYLGAIFWTLGYDTIYGYQDIKDDEIIGLKSTSIKFKKNIKLFVSGAYLLVTIIMIYLFKNNIGINIFTILLILFILTLIFQIRKFDVKKPKECLVAFKNNNISGLILFLSICTINL